MRGSIQERSDGRFSVRTSYYDEDGKRHRPESYFRTRYEAEQALQAMDGSHLTVAQRLKQRRAIINTIRNKIKNRARCYPNITQPGKLYLDAGVVADILIEEFNPER